MATLVSTGQLTIVDTNDGQSVAEISVYARKASTPNTPTGGAYNFTTQALTVPTSADVTWYSTPDGTSGTATLYISRARATYDPTKGTTTLTAWTTPVQLSGSDGSNAIAASNNNYVHQLSAYANGEVKSYVGSGTTISVVEGGVGLTWVSNATTLTNGTFKITGTTLSPANSITVPAIASATIGDLSGMTADTVSITYNISYLTSKGVSGTISTVQTVDKKLDAPSATISATASSFSYPATGTGATPSSSTVTATSFGVSSTPHYEFFVGSTSVQTKSTTVTYTYTPNNAYSNMPQTVTVKVYPSASSAVVLAQASIAMNATRVGDPGTPGTNTATVALYAKNTSNTTAPDTFSGTFTYSFSNRTLSGGNLNGWSTIPPSITKGEYLWARYAITSSTTNTSTIYATDFSSAVIAAVSGIDGTGTPGVTVKTATVYLYYQSASTTNPSDAPTSSVPTYGTNPYNFDTGVFTTTNPSAWKQSPPEMQAGTTVNKYWYKQISISQTGTNNQSITAGETLLGTNFTNLVTFTSLSTPGSTQIDGGNITTGTVNADRIDTKSLYIKNAAGQTIFSAGSLQNWSGNYVDLSWWKRGATIPWTTNGETNAIVSVSPTTTGADYKEAGPKGDSDLVWYCQEVNNDSGAGGGWNASLTSIDPNKTYRFAILIKFGDVGNGTAYWGTGNVCDLNTATVNGNPYFASIASTNLSRDRWYLFVGYVFPYGSTKNTNDGAGIWDCKTGVKIADGTNYCHAPTGANVHRAYQYYASYGASQKFSRPMVHLVDGTEPSLREFFEASTVFNSYNSLGQNLISNSDCTSTSCWTTGWNQYGAQLTFINVYASSVVGWDTTNYVLAGSTTRNLVWRQNGYIAGGNNDAQAVDLYPHQGTWSRDSGFPVVTGQKYIFSCYVQTHRCKSAVHIQFWDGSGNALASAWSSVQDPINGSANALSQYKRLYVTATAPANAVSATVLVRKYNTVDYSGDSYIWLAAPMLESVNPNATTPSPYTAGPVGKATALGALSSVSSSILSATISVDAVAGAGFKAGDLTWNESGTRTGGKGVAMTPGGLLGHNGTNTTFAIDASTGAATFSGTLSVVGSTAGSGSMEITNSAIIVKDSSNNIRVKLGKLS